MSQRSLIRPNLHPMVLKDQRSMIYLSCPAIRANTRYLLWSLPISILLPTVIRQPRVRALRSMWQRAQAQVKSATSLVRKTSENSTRTSGISRLVMLAFKASTISSSVLWPIGSRWLSLPSSSSRCLSSSVSVPSTMPMSQRCVERKPTRWPPNV